MEPKIVVGGARVFLGDCRDVLRSLPDNSVDSVVTDPPYELGFMGKRWDSTGIAYDVTVWEECLRVLKPGGHVLAFGGSRTWHRLAVAIEDSGFQLRDSIAWLYSTGFPKSLDVSKAIDKRAGAEREVVGHALRPDGSHRVNVEKKDGTSFASGSNDKILTSPATSEAKTWQGWGTALKPAFEPVVVGRKPFGKGVTVAENVLAWGVGGLNIDGSRIGSETGGWNGLTSDRSDNHFGKFVKSAESRPTQGRWPANVILDEVTAGLLDEQSGVSKVGGAGRSKNGDGGVFGGGNNSELNHYGDTGGASRFFYVAKASRRDRNEGLNLCQCDKLGAWEKEDQTAPPQADTDQSALKDTGASGTPNNGDSEWSTSLSGNSTTANSKTGNKFTTSTGTSSTTESTTSLPLTVSPTSDSTQDVSLKTGFGGSRVNSAASQSPSELNTGTSVRKNGPNTGGADPVTSELSSGQSNVGSHQCAKCLGIIGGHPTVKPTQLMRYLIKLVTPPGGTVLDPFTGSGSTGKAALLDGFGFVGAELTEEYLPIIEGRLRWAVENRETEETLF